LFGSSDDAKRSCETQNLNSIFAFFMHITSLFKDFTASEKSSGALLIACTVISVMLANSSVGESYIAFWKGDLAGIRIDFLVNDGLMTIFFLMVGLEIEREFYKGELSGGGRALLPVFAAIGGMLVPALIHLAFNFGGPGQKGFGIPMATDIAFSLAVLSLLGSRVPPALRIFLTALAIIDDLGAIIIIALFYTTGFSATYLLVALVIFMIMLVLNRLKFHYASVYLLLGTVMWYCMYRSGIHPTISGVMLAFALPFGNGDERSPSYKLQKRLHFPVAFLIMPLFALANTAIRIDESVMDSFFTSNSIGIIAGLFAGKPLGILLFSTMAIAMGICKLPASVKTIHVLGAGMLAGIGFTMSMFITLLAFNDEDKVDNSRIAIIAGSVVSAFAGLAVLYFGLRKSAPVEDGTDIN
jgi:Na+:H+ antiporter, NhaA family